MPVMNTFQLPFNGDANHFLKLLSFTLDSNGGLININSNTLSIMESCKLMVDRCMIMHAMRATKEDDLKLLLNAGAWDELFFWLRESRSGANVCMLMELLQLYKMLPVNTQLLRQNSCAKEIKQLIKFPDDRVSRLAKVVVSDWMEKVAGVPISSLKSGLKLTNKTVPTKSTPEDCDPILSDQNNHVLNKNLSVESPQRLDSNIDSQVSAAKRPRTVKSLGLRMRSTGEYAKNDQSRPPQSLYLFFYENILILIFLF